jgi:hypothetical protein
MSFRNNHGFKKLMVCGVCSLLLNSSWAGQDVNVDGVVNEQINKLASGQAQNTLQQSKDHDKYLEMVEQGSGYGQSNFLLPTSDQPPADVNGGNGASSGTGAAPAGDSRDIMDMIGKNGAKLNEEAKKEGDFDQDSKNKIAALEMKAKTALDTASRLKGTGVFNSESDEKAFETAMTEVYSSLLTLKKVQEMDGKALDIDVDGELFNADQRLCTTDATKAVCSRVEKKAVLF